MKVQGTVTIVFNERMSKSAFRKLTTFAETHESGDTWIEAKYLLPSQRFDALVEAAHKASLNLWKDRQFERQPTQFKIDGKITFEEADLASASYLQACPKHEFIDCTEESYAPSRVTLDTSESNLAEMDRTTRKKLLAGELHLAQAGFDHAIVSKKFKEAWEESGLDGIDFVDGFVCTGPEAAKLKGQYWLFLPRKKIELADGEDGLLGQITRLVADKAIAAEIVKHNSILMLDRASVAKQEPFEIAQTVFKENGQEKPGLVIGSQKFRQFCEKLRAEVEWEPALP